ncbi:MAG: hypothetical protein KatS3mg082_2808 [Nitrospiraceae bacterium]|nr:MAG: hypothetical protein KatS3mg082_2808 [Nitrospiraceae bacterium]
MFLVGYRKVVVRKAHASDLDNAIVTSPVMKMMLAINVPAPRFGAIPFSHELRIIATRTGSQPVGGCHVTLFYGFDNRPEQLGRQLLCQVNSL